MVPFPGGCSITEIKHVGPCDPDIPPAGTCPGGSSQVSTSKLTWVTATLLLVVGKTKHNANV